LFLKYFFFNSYNPSTPSKRNSFCFQSRLLFFFKTRKLKTFKKSISGRNDSGKIIFRTKTSKLKKVNFFKINYKLNCLKLGSVLSFKFLPFKNKILSLVYFHNGSLSYFLNTKNHLLFSIFCSFKQKKKILQKFKIKTIFFMLFQFKKLSYISSVELLPNNGSQYIRSSGVKGRIVHFDKETHSALIELPSKVKKVFSFYSWALSNPISLSLHKKCYNNKFGFWRSFGKKPITRGVAKNPVDHPHGGRTKSIKYPRTPWGKTTKFK